MKKIIIDSITLQLSSEKKEYIGSLNLCFMNTGIMIMPSTQLQELLPQNEYEDLKKQIIEKISQSFQERIIVNNMCHKEK